MKFCDGTSTMIFRDKADDITRHVVGGVRQASRVRRGYLYHQLQDGRKSLSLLCSTRQIRSRGDTLNPGTIGVEIDAAFEGVTSVEVTHWSGSLRRGPSFELYPDDLPSNDASVSKGDAGTTLQSGSLSATVTVNEHTFDIKFYSTEDNRTLIALQNRSVGLAYSPGFINPKITEDTSQLTHYTFTQADLGVGESIHGLGECFDACNKVGQSMDLWTDSGTSSDQA